MINFDEHMILTLQMDKNSVLGDAIKYLKHLQERVHSLEEQSAKQNLESVIVKRSRLQMEDEGSSYESNSSCEQHLPEIEARVCNNHIHLSIHSKKHKGVLSKILCEVEKLNLTVIYTNVTPFGNFAFDINIITEVITLSMLVDLLFLQIINLYWTSYFVDGGKIQLDHERDRKNSWFGPPL